MKHLHYRELQSLRNDPVVVRVACELRARFVEEEGAELVPEVAAEYEQTRDEYHVTRQAEEVRASFVTGNEMTRVGCQKGKGKRQDEQHDSNAITSAADPIGRGPSGEAFEDSPLQVVEAFLSEDGNRCQHRKLRQSGQQKPGQRCLLALLIILATCFLTGLAVSTRPGEWVERRLLRPLPAYSTLQNLTRRFAGTGDGLEFSPALARIHGSDSMSLCFVVEEHGDGMVTVFVPLAPTPTIGFVYLIEADKIEPLDVPMGSAVNCAMQWGIGLRGLRQQASATATD